MKRCVVCFVQEVYATAGTVRCYFHEKRHGKLIGPLSDYLDEVEVNAVMDGRLHQDGRRLDSYITPDRMVP